MVKTKQYVGLLFALMLPLLDRSTSANALTSCSSETLRVEVVGSEPSPDHAST